MKKIVSCNIPQIYFVTIDQLDSSDIFNLERVQKIAVSDFVLVKHHDNCIFINKELENVKGVEETINKIMASKYLPEKLFDTFESLTDKKSAYTLLNYWSDWRKKINERNLHDKASQILAASKSLHIHQKVKRNRDIIKELFDIGYGIYTEDPECNYQQGAENAFVYGYLLGTQAK